MNTENIHPIEDLLLKREEKESLLKQRGKVFWFCGLSGSGKSTLAVQVEKDLHHEGIHSLILDGDNLRSSLNKDLGFSDNDREENIRRVSEIAKILANNGLLVIASFITPRKKFRDLAREIIGEDIFHEIYIKASIDKCEARDVKGLYAKESRGEIKSLTGKESTFEEPTSPWMTIDTEHEKLSQSSRKLFDAITKQVKI
ncbi:MAG: adenylyl-sulfate kinase [Opitutae bacterium]|jgi:adenylylsulfate kinase|nr:adenylyl-sulfate kinase [Opitutae bacterium]MBT5717445.1 adenylyl-sulfate kinase [Opitutae bacterium]